MFSYHSYPCLLVENYSIYIYIYIYHIYVHSCKAVTCKKHGNLLECPKLFGCKKQFDKILEAIHANQQQKSMKIIKFLLIQEESK